MENNRHRQSRARERRRCRSRSRSHSSSSPGPPAFRSTLVVPDLKLLTPAQACNALALQNAALWFSVAGAGAAVLATLLKGRARIHRAFACVALASAVAIHGVVTWLLGVTVVTAPNDDLLLLSVMSAVVFIFFAWSTRMPPSSCSVELEGRSE